MPLKCVYIAVQRWAHRSGKHTLANPILLAQPFVCTVQACLQLQLITLYPQPNSLPRHPSGSVLSIAQFIYVISKHHGHDTQFATTASTAVSSCCRWNMLSEGASVIETKTFNFPQKRKRIGWRARTGGTVYCYSKCDLSAAQDEE